MLGVLGDLVEDIIVWQREPLRPATDTDAALTRTRGGSAANVAALAAALHPTRFIGCVGEDAVGDSLVAGLRAEGVDVRVQRGGTTGAIVVLVDPHGERTMLPDRGASTRLAGVAGEWLSDLDHLHVPAYSFTEEPAAGSAIDCLLAVRADGATTSVDASSTGALEKFGPAAMIDVLSGLAPDILFANREEAGLLGLWDGHDAGPARARIEDTTIVVKDGARPTTVLFATGEVAVVPVAEVAEVRDLTGAGDAFAAGFLAARLAGTEARRACVAGHSVAATVLASPGASRAPTGMTSRCIG